jgi:hypothetical protein
MAPFLASTHPYYILTRPLILRLTPNPPYLQSPAHNSSLTQFSTLDTSQSSIWGPNGVVNFAKLPPAPELAPRHFPFVGYDSYPYESLIQQHQLPFEKFQEDSKAVLSGEAVREFFVELLGAALPPPHLPISAQQYLHADYARLTHSNVTTPNPNIFSQEQLRAHFFKRLHGIKGDVLGGDAANLIGNGTLSKIPQNSQNAQNLPNTQNHPNLRDSSTENPSPFITAAIKNASPAMSSHQVGLQVAQQHVQQALQAQESQKARETPTPLNSS